MKLTKEFRCVLPGEIYPVDLQSGDECPEGYEESARAQGAFDEVEGNPVANGDGGEATDPAGTAETVETAETVQTAETPPEAAEAPVATETAEVTDLAAAPVGAADKAATEDATPAASKKKN